VNIIITNIGRRGYLVDYIKEISDFSGKVFVSDCSDTASGLYGDNDGRFLLPRPIDDERKYVDTLIDICIKYNIRLVIPVIDPEIYILSRYREEFDKKNICVIVSSREVLDICYNKIIMNKFLDSNNFEVAKTFISVREFKKSYNRSEVTFPVMLKPVYGSGSIDTYKASTLEEVLVLFQEGMIIQEMIQGEEYGIDVLNNMQGFPIRCVVKKKLEMRSGETDKAVIVHDSDIAEHTIQLARNLKHIGNLDIDLIRCGNKKYFIDLNPRFGGGYPATHSSGENYLGLIIDMVSGKIPKQDFDHYNADILVMKSVKIVTHPWKSVNRCRRK